MWVLIRWLRLPGLAYPTSSVDFGNAHGNAGLARYVA
jgi:hypothetical protein